MTESHPSSPCLSCLQPRPCAGIRVRQLTMAGRGDLLATGFSADFQPGKIHQIEAPNGSGKSSLLLCLAGLEMPDSGTIEIQADHSVRKDDAALKSWLPPHDDFPVPVSAIDVVLAGRWRFHGGKPSDHDVAIALDCLHSLEIGHLGTRPVVTLSTGQRRRVNLARVFAQDADVLLLDEPFSGLDRDAKRRVEECIHWITTLGRTVIVARPS